MFVEINLLLTWFVRIIAQRSQKVRLASVAPVSDDPHGWIQ
jgi:hypothetical protein